jgi:hypothetical protein
MAPACFCMLRQEISDFVERESRLLGGDDDFEDLPNAWRKGEDPRPKIAPINWKSKPLASLAAMAVVKFQLRRLSQGRKSSPGVSPFKALLLGQLRTASLTRKYRRWIASSGLAATAAPRDLPAS